MRMYRLLIINLSYPTGYLNSFIVRFINEIILNDILDTYQFGRKPLILIENIDLITTCEVIVCILITM